MLSGPDDRFDEATRQQLAFKMSVDEVGDGGTHARIAFCFGVLLASIFSAIQRSTELRGHALARAPILTGAGNVFFRMAS